MSFTGGDPHAFQPLFQIYRRNVLDRNPYEILHDFLAEKIPQTGYVYPESPLVVAVGEDAINYRAVLSQVFGQQPFGFAAENVTFVGIDRDKEVITSAKFCQSLGRSRTRNEDYPMSIERYVCIDARELKGKFFESIDAVVVCNPNMTKEPGNWEAVFAELSKVQKPDGLLVVSTKTDTDYALAERAIKDAGYTIAPQRRTPEEAALQNFKITLHGRTLELALPYPHGERYFTFAFNQK